MFIPKILNLAVQKPKAINRIL